MPRYLIDSAGRVWDPFDEQLLAVLGDADPDYDILAYAVRNLGAVDVNVRDQVATLRFRWLTVSRGALASLTRMLITLPVDAVVIHSETKLWNEHRFLNTAEAIEWLEAAQEGGSDISKAINRQEKSHHLVATPRTLKSIGDRPLSRLEEADDHFSFFFKKWRLAQKKFSTDITEALVRFGDLDRSVVAREQSSNSTLVFEHVGSRITLYNRSDDAWTFRFSGRPVTEQPDPEYGRYTDRVFRQVLDSAEPRFDHIDAVVSDGRGAQRFQYDRLLLPWQLNSGERVLTSLSFKTSPDLVAPDLAAKS
jgi:hypothetical protein